MIHEKRLLLELPTEFEQIAIGLNSAQYRGSDEGFGICPFPNDVMEQLRIDKCKFVFNSLEKQN